MKRIILLTVCILLLGISNFKAQTWGCGERDFKCQLDVRMKALKDDPKDPDNYYNLGIVFQRNGSHKEAVETFSMYISIPGLKPQLVADGYNNRAISQRALNNLELAYADYTKAIELKPTDPIYLVNRGNLNAARKNADEALADYARAIAIDPKYYSTYAQRGILYVNISRIDEALRDFAKSIELNPSYAEPYYNRGTVYSGRKEYDKAIPDYTKYVSLIDDPVYLADGYINRGIANRYLGNPQKALEDFSKVIELRPKWQNGYRARALLYREMKKPDLATADEKTAVDLASKQPTND